MCLPIRTCEPLIFGLTGRKIFVDFHIVKTRPPRHRILIRDDMALRAQVPLKPVLTDQPGESEPASIGKAWEINANKFHAMQ